ncbi:MAG: hypothetical protein IGBAC_1624 [Ignavibacteriae bacterium]|nr:MAG: hypothetical protein IGBAC_1624 [Ignavibacteriota bacterium]
MKNQKSIILTFLLILFFLFGYNLMFTIHKLEVSKEPDYLFPDGNSTITICVKPLNRFGMIIPFKNVNVNFEIVEGNEKVKIIEISSNKLILRSRYDKGFVILRINNAYTLLPIEIIIEIKGQLA